MKFVIAVLTLVTLCVASAATVNGTESNCTDWNSMTDLGALNETINVTISAARVPVCKITQDDEELTEIRCRFIKDNSTTKTPYECPATEKEALYEIWALANGENWTNAGEAGWKKFTKPMKRWKEACDEAPDLTGAYYASNYDGIQCKDGYVVDIQLSDNNMEGRLSKAIGCFVYAKHINLSHNKLIKAVPGTVRNLKDSLQDFDIQDNQFTKLTKAICRYEENCKSLYIADNPWIKTPDCLEDMKTSCPANDIP